MEESTHVQRMMYCKFIVLSGIPLVSRVFLKNTFFKKKLGRYPHVPLWGLYKAYPKAFFCRTSLEGQTTVKNNDFYNIDFTQSTLAFDYAL